MVKDVDKSANFLMKEYENARKRIDSDIDEINKSEIYFLTIFGLLYWFIFQIRFADAIFLRIALFLPFVVAVFGTVRYTAHRHVIKTHESYIKEKIESYFLEYGRDPCGLVFFYDERSPKYLKPVRYAFHSILILFASIFFLYSLCDGEKAISLVNNSGYAQSRSQVK